MEKGEMRVLVVDDHGKIRQLIATVLRRGGYKDIVYAENGNIAWDEIMHRKPDLIVLDWDMPEMTGIELLQHIRSTLGYEDLKILMLTAHAEREYVVTAIESGVDDYLLKPFTPDALYDKLDDMLKDVL